MTAPVQLAPADLAAFVDELATAGLGQVSYDPAALKLMPGVWVRIDGIDLAEVLADGYAVVDVTIHLIVGEKPVTDALPELLPLLDKLCDVLTPTGPVTLVGIPLQGSTTLRPALAVPFQLRTAPTPEEE